MENNIIIIRILRRKKYNNWMAPKIESRGIEPKTGLKPFLKTALNVFVCIKLFFF